VIYQGLTLKKFYKSYKKYKEITREAKTSRVFFTSIVLIDYYINMYNRINRNDEIREAIVSKAQEYSEKYYKYQNDKKTYPTGVDSKIIAKEIDELLKNIENDIRSHIHNSLEGGIEYARALKQDPEEILMEIKNGLKGFLSNTMYHLEMAFNGLQLSLSHAGWLFIPKYDDFKLEIAAEFNRAIEAEKRRYSKDEVERKHKTWHLWIAGGSFATAIVIGYLNYNENSSLRIQMDSYNTRLEKLEKFIPIKPHIKN
jgi:hypothetical protein